MKRFQALSALLLSLRLLCPAVLASEPPPLEPRLTVLDESIRLEILSTGPLALSNYDFDLEWDTERLPLTSAVSEVGGTFLWNESGRHGSSMSGGNDFRLDPGAALLTVTFRPEETLSEGEYRFRITFETAAQADGEALPWEGESISASFFYEKPRSHFASVTAEDGALRVEALCLETGARLSRAAYSETGRLLRLDTLPAQAGLHTYTFTPEGARSAFFLLDASLRPLCPEARSPAPPAG